MFIEWEANTEISNCFVCGLFINMFKWNFLKHSSIIVQLLERFNKKKTYKTPIKINYICKNKQQIVEIIKINKMNRSERKKKREKESKGRNNFKRWMINQIEKRKTKRNNNRVLSLFSSTSSWSCFLHIDISLTYQFNK